MLPSDWPLGKASVYFLVDNFLRGTTSVVQLLDRAVVLGVIRKQAE